MAKLPGETTETVNSLKQQLLDIVDQATAVEFALFERFGETDRTIIVLDELKNAHRKQRLGSLSCLIYSCGLQNLNPLPLLIC